jgi:5'-nucleotidase
MNVTRPPALVTNDDGIDSAGLRLLAVAAADAGLSLVVAAPAMEASGSSAAMTGTPPEGRIVVKRRELVGLDQVPAYAVDALPAFIAFTGARGAFGCIPELVLSGINKGPNTGRAILHSGTVGAALTAATSGIRSVALSLDTRDPAGEPHWETAMAVAAEVIPAAGELPPGVMLNVNVPNVPRGELRGIRRGRLASFGAVQVAVLETAEDHFQVTMAEATGEPEAGSDSALLAAGYASVTPLRPLCEASPSWLPWLPWPAAEMQA